MVKKFLINWKKTGIILFLILLFAFLIRIYHLTSMPVFADEAIYIRWSQVMAADNTLRFLPLSDGKQPFYMWILMFLMNKRFDPLFLGRVISVFSGIGTIAATFGISYSLFKSKKVALIASFMTAIVPFSFFFDRMALVDSLLTMFGMWTLLLGIITAKTKRLDMAMLTGFSLGGALLTKSPALFFAVLLPLTLVVSKWPKKRMDVLTHVFHLVGLLLVTYVIGYGMYGILRLGPNSQFITIRNMDYVYPISHLFGSGWWDPFTFHFKEVFTDWFMAWGPGLLTLFFFPGIFTTVRKHKWEVVLIFAWFIVPLLATSEFGKVFTARYILYTLPPFYMLLASAFLERNKIYTKILTIVFIFLVINSLRIDYLFATNIEVAPIPSSERSGYLEEWTSGTGIKEVSDYIKGVHSQNPGKGIVVGTEGLFGTLPDGLQIYLNEIPNLTVVGVGLDLDKVPSNLVNSKRSGNFTYLVVNNDRLKFTNPESKGLRLIAAYPKAFRLDKNAKEYKNLGPRETLYLFELVDSGK
ncbi:MAG TPA: glycosyltransferase family 39 protein [Patescibacteria group bacterium]